MKSFHHGLSPILRSIFAIARVGEMRLARKSSWSDKHGNSRVNFLLAALLGVGLLLA